MCKKKKEVQNVMKSANIINLYFFTPVTIMQNYKLNQPRGACYF